jgi:spoIIIJ-associated protein
MQPKEFSGKTTEEAIRQAEQHFGLPLERLQVEVLEAGSGGILGLFGGRKAKVLVQPLADSAKEAMEEVMREFRGEPQAPAPQAPSPPRRDEPAPAPAPSSESARAVDTQPAAEARPEPAPGGRPRHAIADYSDQAEPEAPARPPARPREETLEEPREQPGEEQGPAREPEGPEVMAQAQKVLQRLVEPLDPTARVEGRLAGGGIELSVDGEEAGILIGRRGQTLDALQYLTVRIVSHQEGRPVRVSVDAGGYRRRRRESLEELARRTAAKAKSGKRPLSVGPFSAQGRRVVHLALKNEPGVTTNSRGRGELKKVLISPKG